MSFFTILILIWAAVYEVNVNVLEVWEPYSFPSPLDFFKTLVHLIKDNTILIATVASLKRLFLGYLVSLGLGLLLGLIIVSNKYIDDNMSSLILGLQTLPSICWLPFAILWYGINESAIIFLISIGSTFAISMALVDAIKNVNPLYIRAARTMGAKGVKLYTTVVIPAALPSLISGMKQGWSFAWRALMAGEMLSSTKGLGQVLMVGRDLADISQVLVIMVVIVVLGVIFEKLIFGNIENRIRIRFGLTK